MNSMQVYGVIMAGGGGTRFWPLSRQKTPKQLLNLSGKDVMVNETIDRLALSIPGKNQYIVTSAAQAPAMARATEGRVLPEHILCEPSARNTAACIGYAALEIIKKRGDGILCVTPSDAYVRDWPAFNAVLEQAVQAAETQDKLVTIGITPTFAATGYGYIRYDKAEEACAKTVQAFVEKPPLETAQRYLAEGSYAWNSGIFVWRASTILRFFRQLLPDVWAPLAQIEAALGTEQEKAVIEKVYPTIPIISIDYGIMEKAAACAKTVQAFVEKPPLETAQRYLAEGSYAWNSGIFVWRASTILRFFRQLLPDVWAPLAQIEAALGTEQEKAVIEKVYPTIPSISIDYGIMEKAAAMGQVRVVAGEFGWNDVGSWDMLKVLHEPDAQGNILLGDTLALESAGNIVYAGSRTVTLVGVQDMILVETPDSVMLCPKEKAQDVKKIVDALKAAGRTELL